MSNSRFIRERARLLAAWLARAILSAAILLPPRTRGSGTP
jgi:hypothetical protein